MQEKGSLTSVSRLTNQFRIHCRALMLPRFLCNFFLRNVYDLGGEILPNVQH